MWKKVFARFNRSWKKVSFRRKLTAFALFLLIFVLMEACKGESEPMSDFLQSFLDYPERMSNLSQEDPRTRRLLEKFKPRIFVAPKSYVPISFYEDYLPRCVARRRGFRRKIAYNAVNRNILRKIQNDTQFYLDFLPTRKQTLTWTPEMVNPTLCGRIYRDTLSFDDHAIDLLFLKYSFSMPYSGLPCKLSWWKSMGIRLIGDRYALHELDIHGAIHVVLDAKSERPLGIILAQHNYHRVFLRDRDFKWPADNHIPISIAEFSNEPYLMEFNEGDRYEPVAGNPLKIDFLFGRTKKVPLAGGYDHILTPGTGAQEVDMALELLPINDPLYTAIISLGDRKRLFWIRESWYFSGPPGIDYYTFPELKNLADLMSFWYIDPADDRLFQLLEDSVRSFYDYDLAPILAHQKKRLYKALLPLTEE